MDMIINFHNVLFKYIITLFVHYTSIKMEKKEMGNCMGFLLD